MAKDDYDVITYKVLVYLYACFKRKIVFEEVTFMHAIGKNINPELLKNVLRLMTTEDLITGLHFKKCWGEEFLMLNDLPDMNITAKGIHYLKENRAMKKVQEHLINSVDAVAALIGIVFKA